MSVLENVEPKQVLYFFEEISKIPRETGNEKGVSDYIKGWAEEHNLPVQQDEYHNLIVERAAAPGEEGREPIILQAHLDMVCEKTGDSDHDFERDPILLKIEGDIISSAVGTTLGADDGIGVAMCMAILVDGDLKNPPLEVIFTVSEETDFGGAKTVAVDRLKGKRLLNLDHAVENEVLAGGCGGEAEDLEIPMTKKEVSGYGCRKITLGGLPGGHSGEDIARGNGDAIALLARVLRSCREELDLKLYSFTGGTGGTAIPREAETVIMVKAEEEGELRRRIEELRQEIAREYQVVAPNFFLNLDVPAPGDCGCEDACTCFDDESFEKFLRIIELFPRGIMEMSGAVPGNVESSINPGIVKTHENGCAITAELRGSMDSTIQQVKRKVVTLTETFGGTMKSRNYYTSWDYNPTSALREAVTEIYRELFNEELRTTVVHAGIEAGIFTKRIPGLDAISLGPNCWSFHSPEERMSASSADKVWKFLRTIIETI